VGSTPHGSSASGNRFRPLSAHGFDGEVNDVMNRWPGREMFAARRITWIVRYTNASLVTGTSMSRCVSGVYAQAALAGPYSVFKGLMPRRREIGQRTRRRVGFLSEVSHRP
jgi:hypothetical protein